MCNFFRFWKVLKRSSVFTAFFIVTMTWCSVVEIRNVDSYIITNYILRLIALLQSWTDFLQYTFLINARICHKMFDLRTFARKRRIPNGKKSARAHIWIDYINWGQLWRNKRHTHVFYRRKAECFLHFSSVLAIPKCFISRYSAASKSVIPFIKYKLIIIKDRSQKYAWFSLTMKRLNQKQPNIRQKQWENIKNNDDYDRIKITFTQDLAYLLSTSLKKFNIKWLD